MSKDLEKQSTLSPLVASGANIAFALAAHFAFASALVLDLPASAAQRQLIANTPARNL